MSLNLKDAINKTNLEKDKLILGKNNIDAKLVELGGEKAIDIADVPNKIQKLTDKFIKVAEGELNVSTTLEWANTSSDGVRYVELNLSNLNFNARILKFEISVNNGYSREIDISRSTDVNGNGATLTIFGLNSGSFWEGKNLKIKLRTSNTGSKNTINFLRWKAYDKHIA